LYNLYLNRLSSLGYSKFNWSIGEQQTFQLKKWSCKKSRISDIANKNNKKYSGDRYAK